MKINHLLYLVFAGLIVTGCKDSDSTPQPIQVAAADIPKRWEIVHNAIDSIREGDLVLRCGNDMTSYMLKDFSQTDKVFSHSGLAFKWNDSLYVFHNMAGDLNPDEVMRKDRIDSFLTPVSNMGFGIYRYDLDSQELAALKQKVIQHYENKLPFDMSFDLSTDDKMYCVEMIAKSVEEASRGRIQFTRSIVNADLKRKYLKMALQKKVLPSRESANQREYLAIDNLYMTPHCRPVTKTIFETNNGPVRIPSGDKE
ncbi:MAG: hypothetical protein J0M30_11695 [Chitinophagales bacterium]|nr:hypothetical protein [Chitinophagales bacterium]